MMTVRGVGILVFAVLAAACSQPRAVVTPSASSTVDSTKLFGVNWLLRTLDGQPAPLGAGDRPATLTLGAADHRVSGFGGCNRFLGSFALVGDSIDLKAIAMTRMACEQGNDLEVRFTALLERVNRVRVSDSTLSLLVGDSIVAGFSNRAAAGRRPGARGARTP